jgi:small-conductance mechanosensitive channel
VSNPPDRPALPIEVRRLLWITSGTGLAASAVALAALAATGTRLTLHLAAAVTIAITVSLVLAGALMGLLFASSRSGHDDDAGQPD